MTELIWPEVKPQDYHCFGNAQSIEEASHDLVEGSHVD